MAAALDHIHLACRHLEASERFYRTYFDAELLARYAWRDVRSVALRIGDTRVNLTSGLAGPAFNHLGLGLGDLESAYERMQRDGVDVQSGPHRWEPERIDYALPDLSLAARFAFVNGPDGELLELVDRSES
jgi:catechol 2,3-dioxygenase-like lactoylglutathione lyase family enzyme